MAQESQVPVTVTPESMPVKRKRGRPRKDGTEIGSPRPPKVPAIRAPAPTSAPAPAPSTAPVNAHSVASASASDAVQRSQRRRADPPSGGTNDPLVGKPVHGVLDGSFEAGYLLTVQIGDTDTIMRGVVFRPELSVPLSGANDLAPHINMVRRVEVPILVGHPSNQGHGPASQSAQKNGRAVELQQQNLNQVPVNEAPVAALQVSSPQLQSIHVPVKEVQNNNKEIPETVIHATRPAEPKTVNAAEGHSVDVNQPIQFSLDGRDSSKDKVNFPAVGSADTDQASLSTPLNSMSGVEVDNDASKGVNLKHKAPSTEISLNHVPQAQSEDQVVGSELNIDRSFVSMFQASKVVGQPVPSGPIAEPTKSSESNVQGICSK